MRYLWRAAILTGFITIVGLLAACDFAPGPVTATPSAATPAAGGTSQPVTVTLLTGHTGRVTNVAWSPDGKLLASSAGDIANSDDPTVRLWNADGSSAGVLSGHTGAVTSLAWSPHGQTLASGSRDQTIRLWKPDGMPAGTISSAAGTVFSLAWSPDSLILAAASIITFPHPTVQLWHPDGALAKTMSTNGSGGKFFNLAWSPDGKWVAGGAEDYKLWRSDGSEVAHTSGGGPAWALAWDASSSRWTIGDESGNVEVYDTAGHIVTRMHNPSGNADALAWSVDGNVLAGGDGVTFWHADGTLLRNHPDIRDRINSVAWSPDGKMLASGGSDGIVRLWAPDGALLANLTGHTDRINSVAWSPDGRSIASGSDDRTVRIWHMASIATP